MTILPYINLKNVSDRATMLRETDPIQSSAAVIRTIGKYSESLKGLSAVTDSGLKLFAKIEPDGTVEYLRVDNGFSGFAFSVGILTEKLMDWTKVDLSAKDPKDLSELERGVLDILHMSGLNTSALISQIESTIIAPAEGYARLQAANTVSATCGDIQAAQYRAKQAAIEAFTVPSVTPLLG